MSSVARITDITQQTRRPDRVSVFVDGEFWVGMQRSVCAQLDLRVGEELTAQRRRLVEQAVVDSEALRICVETLARFSRTRHQLAEKLRSREFGEAVIAATLRRLDELQLVDDGEYARAVVAQRKSAGQGRWRIGRYLSQAGIPADLAERVLDELYPPDEEEAIATQALRRRFADRLGRREQARALAFLQRRGFDPQVCASVVAGHSLTDDEQREREDPSEAAELIRGRYGDALSDRATQQKAWALLARRGYTSQTCRRALELARRPG
jgi:regulatory protein